MLLGVRRLCCLLLALLQRGKGSPDPPPPGGRPGLHGRPGGRAQGLAGQRLPTGSLAPFSPPSQRVRAGWQLPGPQDALGRVCHALPCPQPWCLPRNCAALAAKARAKPGASCSPSLPSARSPLLRSAWPGRRRGGPRSAGTTLAHAPKLAGHWGCPWLCSPGTPCLLAAGRGDAEYGDLVDEGLYLYLDEDGPPEVLGGPARCQDTYQDWISLYCWAPFHAALMATPEGSRCRWDQISSTYSELSGCTQLLAQLLSCPWPSTVLDAFFLQVHAEYFTNCTGARPPGLGGLPPGMAVAVAVGLGCLVPLAAALTLRRAWKGAQTPAGSCPAPACPRACEGPAAAPFPPGPGNRRAGRVG